MENQTRYLGGDNGPRGVRSREIAPPSNDQWGLFHDGQIGSRVFRPEMRLAGQHEFGATGSSLTANFATLGGTPFTVAGTTIGRDSLLAGAGFVILWNDRLSTFVYYDGQFGDQNYESHNVSGGIRLQF